MGIIIVTENTAFVKYGSEKCKRTEGVEDVLEHLGAQRNENGLYYGKVLHSKKANSQTSGKTSAATSEISHLTAMQKQTVANYARTKVYTKAAPKPLVP